MTQSKRRVIWDMGFDRMASITRLYEWTKEQKNGASLFGQVLGRLYSSSLAEEITRISDLNTTWGQIIDDKGALSPEVDLILYKGRPYVSWSSIGFSLVRAKDVQVTFECKTELLLDNTEIKKFGKQVRTLQEFTGNTAKHYIFASYSYLERTTYENWANKLRQQGWTDVFLLYDGPQGDKERREDWHRLMDSLP